jgi:D-xylose transport system permease protein
MPTEMNQDVVAAVSAGGPVPMPENAVGAGRQPLKRRLSAAMMGPWRLTPILVALGVIWAFFEIQSPVFLSSQNLTNLTSQIAVSSLVALALVFLLLVRQIDISLASLAAVSGAIAADLSVEAHWNAAVAVVVALLAGLAVGLIQSLIVTIFRAPAFIITLGGLFILNATLLWLLPATQVVPLADTPLAQIAGTYVSGWLSYLLGAVVVCGYAGLLWSAHRGRRAESLPSRLVTSTVVPAVLVGLVVLGLVLVFNSYRGIPTPGVIVAGAFLIMSYVANQTPFGRRVYAVGGNPEAARRAGIHVGAVTCVTFAIGGCLASLAGVIEASRELGVSAQSNDLTLLLGALAAVVIGGVSLFGGRGTVWGALIGGIVIGSIQNGLDLINSSTQVEWTVEGVVLIAAVVIDALISRAAPESGE